MSIAGRRPRAGSRAAPQRRGRAYPPAALRPFQQQWLCDSSSPESPFAVGVGEAPVRYVIGCRALGVGRIGLGRATRRALLRANVTVRPGYRWTQRATPTVL